jgi:hypothetical protein
MDAAVIGHNLAVTTGNAILDHLIHLVCAQPEVSARAIMGLIDDAMHSSHRSGDEDLARRIARVRELSASLDRNGRAAEEVRNALGSRHYQEAQRAAGLSNIETERWLENDDNALRLMNLVPHLDVAITLLCRRDANPQQPIRRTDGRDLSFFQLAIPYANLVLAEKAWSHLATAGRHSLAERYETRILTNLSELPRALQDIGCV